MSVAAVASDGYDVASFSSQAAGSAADIPEVLAEARTALTHRSTLLAYVIGDLGVTEAFPVAGDNIRRRSRQLACEEQSHAVVYVAHLRTLQLDLVWSGRRLNGE